MYQASRAPGVYFEWLDPPPRSSLRVRTDIAGFVGIAERGPLHEADPRRELDAVHHRLRRPHPEGYLAYAVEGFFANGGRTCWVVRVADPDTARPPQLDASMTRPGRPVLRLVAPLAGHLGRGASS